MTEQQERGATEWQQNIRAILEEQQNIEEELRGILADCVEKALFERLEEVSGKLIQTLAEGFDGAKIRLDERLGMAELVRSQNHEERMTAISDLSERVLERIALVGSDLVRREDVFSTQLSQVAERVGEGQAALKEILDCMSRISSASQENTALLSKGQDGLRERLNVVDGVIRGREDRLSATFGEGLNSLTCALGEHGKGVQAQINQLAERVEVLREHLNLIDRTASERLLANRKQAESVEEKLVRLVWLTLGGAGVAAILALINFVLLVRLLGAP